MSTPIAALEAALYDRDQPNTRKTFGTVEYALIPVAVIEAVLMMYDADAEDNEEPTDDGALDDEVAVVGFPDDEADGDLDLSVVTQEEE